MMKLEDILKNTSDDILSTAIVESFKEVEHNFFLKSWKTSELDAGHFVEAVRRFIELKLFGKYTPIDKSLPIFNDVCLKLYESGKGDDSYRIFIPRALFSVYTIRNKRGVGHLSKIAPNKIDATLILQTCKWTLAELIRINSAYKIEDTEILIDEIIQRNIEGIWEQGEIKRILADGLKLWEQILVLLYNNNYSDEELYKIIENGDLPYLRKKLENFIKTDL